MKIVIAGTGSIGFRHIRNISRIVPTTQFILLRKDKRVDEFSRKISAIVVSDVSEAMALKPDCAVIATPSAFHTQLILDFIRYGLPLYIEKPVVITQSDVDAIRACIKKYHYSSATLVGCNLRYLNSLCIMKSIIHSGELGKIARASLQAGQWLPDWRPTQDYRISYSSDSARGGGVIWDLIHELDSARFLMGDFDQVKALSSRFEPLEINSEAIAVIIMGKSQGGPLLSVGLDYVSRAPVRKYEIYAEKASLIWDLPGKTLIKKTVGGTEVLTDSAEDFDVAETYIQAMREFFEAIEKGINTSQDIEEGLKSVELALLAKT